MSELDRAQRRLDDALARVARVEGRLPDMLPATVDAVQTNGTVNLMLRGQFVPGVPVSAGYKPKKNDVVQVLYVRGQYWVMGRTGVAADAPGPTETPGMVRVTSASSSTWSAGEGWSVDPRPRQGSDAQYHGLWFFGAGAFSALAGTAITSIRVTMTRVTEPHGDPGPTPVTVWTHPHASRPESSPTLAAGPSSPGSLSIGEQAVFTLPTEFGAYLRDNPSGGLALMTRTDAYYIICDTTAVVDVDWS